ncbi:MAG: hypothetical protein KF819_31560 [Labilithrix sp.]|nr:hypothetical protein [Labilithrix sp.]
MKRTVVAAFAALLLAPVAACSSADVEGVSSVESPATIDGDTVDCFPGCKQADYKTLVKGGLDAACKTLKDGWAKPQLPKWPGWDDKLPICIGHKKDIENRKDCNRLVDAPGWTECKNQLMLVCIKEKKPGFGPIILVPPKGGFPPALKPPSITDQELACIDQWKCPTKKASLSGGLGLATVAAECTRGPDGTCAVCDDSWVREEPQILEPATPEPVPTLRVDVAGDAPYSAPRAM